MADVTLVVTEGIKAGINDIAAATNAKKGNAAGTDDFFMPNDGKTVLALVVGASAKVITFTAVKDKYGRTETLTFTPTSSKSSIVGPFLPELWNDAAGQIKFKPAAGGLATDFYLAMRIAQPT